MRKMFSVLNQCSPLSVSQIQLENESTQSSSIDVNDSTRIVRKNDKSIEQPQPEGLISTLKKHQLIALDWMVSRETEVPTPIEHAEYDKYRTASGDQYLDLGSGQMMINCETYGGCKGGILADSMGIGKTLQMLSLCLARPTEPRQNQALTVTKKEQKLKPRGPVLVVTPVSVNVEWDDEIEKHCEDVTYMCFYNLAQRKKMKLQDLLDCDIVLTTQAILSKEFKTGGSLLYQLDWWRVILDEAHNIKAENTLQAKACFALDAQFKWLLTGTPLPNKIDELYSYMVFLEQHPWSSHPTFKRLAEGFVNKKQKAVDVFLELVAPIMLRRTKDSCVDGLPIVTLPEKQMLTYTVTFSAEEQALQRQLKAETDHMIAGLMRTGESELNKHMISAMSKLLRLKQACCHSNLVKKKINRENWQEFRKTLTLFLTNTSEEWRNTRQEALRADLVGGTCAICFESLEACAMVAACGHVQCATCVDSILGSTAACPECREDWKGDYTTKFKLVPTDIFEAESNGWKDSTKTKMVLNLVNRFINGRDLDEDSVKFKVFDGKNALSSGDINAQPADKCKIVIFSQFNKMLDILEESFKANSLGVKYTRIDGTCNKDKRQERIKQFKNDDDVKLLLATQKTVGEGLNLMVANHVVLVDLWWNSAVEDQAVDRVHRIGQQRLTTVHKLTMEASIEPKLVELHTRKRTLTDAIMEGNRVDAMTLNYKDLIDLLNH